MIYYCDSTTILTNSVVEFVLFSAEYSMRCFSPQQARQRPAACCIFLALCADFTAFWKEKQLKWRWKGGYAVNSDLLLWFYNHFSKFCCRICAFLCRIQHALFFAATSAAADASAAVQWTLPLGNAAIMIDGFIIPRRAEKIKPRFAI